MDKANQILDSVERDFIQIKDDFKVDAMKKYMRGMFDYFGITAPNRKKVLKKYKNEIRELEWDQVKILVLEMWDKPQREFQQFGQDVLDWFPKSYKEDDWKFLEELITKKSWWDTVDFLSSHQYRDYSLLYESNSHKIIDRWLDSGNIWLQRSCLLYQLFYRENTNIEILEKSIGKLKESDEFFIQKAIGWILREYSKTNN